MNRAPREPTAPSIVELVDDELLGPSLSPAERTLLKAIYRRALDAEEAESRLFDLVRDLSIQRVAETQPVVIDGPSRTRTVDPLIKSSPISIPGEPETT